MSELPQVIWHVYLAGPWTSGVHVVGAKWRREVPPSRRLTAREQALPWAYSSVPALAPGQPGGFRRWHPCCRRCLLKDCERWFLPTWPQARYCSPTCQAAAERWRSWHACQRYRATPRGKERRREQARRHRGRALERSVLAESALQVLPIEPPLSAIEARTASESDSTPMNPADCDSVGQRPAEILPKSCGLPCNRPGCYVLFLPSPRSPDQHFCSGSCRQALRRVRQREARPERRRGTASRVVTSVIVDHRQAISVMSPRIEHAVLQE